MEKPKEREEKAIPGMQTKFFTLFRDASSGNFPAF
jgi:hypothetical protein